MAKKMTKQNDALTVDAAAAQEKGMTYGQYKAEQYWKTESLRMKERHEQWKRQQSESDREEKTGKEK